MPVYAEGYDYYVEAENYTETNFRSSGGLITSKDVYSNGKRLTLYYDMGAVDEFYAEYDIECENAGVYTIDMASTPFAAGWASPVYISVGDSEPVKLSGEKFESITGESEVAWYHAGTINLKKGMNKIRFSVRDGRASDGRATFFFDWFGLKKTEYELKEIKSPAPMQTFQQGEELKFEILGSGLAMEDMNVSYDVLDFEGKYVDGGNTVIKKDSISAQVVLKPKKNGSYQIIANCNGKTAVQQFLVVTNLKDRKKVEDSPFALDALIYGQRLNLGEDLAIQFADLLELSGITWIRDRVYFDPYVTKNGNNFKFEMPYTRETGDLLAERGINVHMTMNFHPDILQEGDYGGTIPTNLLDVYRFWKQLAEEYDGAVASWEILNECDLGGGGVNMDGPDVYASAFKAAALGIMDSDTENEVLVLPQGAAAKPDHPSEYVQMLFANDVYDYTSFSSYHHHQTTSQPYASYYKYEETAIPDAYIELAKEHGYKIANWNTESGINQDVAQGSNFSAADQMAQAKFLVTSCVEDMSHGADKKFYFAGKSYQEGVKSWGMTSWSETSPSAYAAYGALSGITHVLGEGVYLGKLKDMPEGVLAYAFADGEDTAIIYYSTSTTYEKYNFDVNIGKASVRHFDIFANEDKLSSQNGIYSLTAEDCPQYIKFNGRLSQDMFTDDYVDEYITVSEQKIVDDSKRVVLLQKYDTPARISARHDGYSLTETSNSVDIEVFNFNDYAVTGTINAVSANGWNIEPASQPVEVAPMSSATVHFEVKPDAFVSQKDIITFYGDMSSGRTSDTVVKATGAKVVNIQPKIADGERFITFRVNNSSDIQRTVKKTTVIVNGTEYTSDEQVVIEPHTLGVYDIPTQFADTDKVLKLDAEIEFTDGSKGYYSGETQFAIAKRAIDMEATPSFILPDDGEIKTPYYYGVDDLYGEFYVAADEKNFYFGGKIKDDAHSAPETGYNIWQNDGIQFSIGKGLPAPSIPYYELGMSLTDKGVAEAHCWADPDVVGDHKLEGVDCKITLDEKTLTTTYYIAIPWEVIPRLSYEDGLLAFSMLINENDGQGRNGYVEWGSGIGKTKDTSLFRTVVFEK